MVLKRFQRGVTLFEMILVMMIIALLSVAAIRYADRERDEAVADRLAQKLYEYGHAAREWAHDNKDDLENSILSVREGVAWLYEENAGTNETGEPYLHDDFTFTEGLDPLFLGEYSGNPGTPEDNTDDLIIFTGFTWNASEDRADIDITIGSLYDANTGLDDAGDPNPPKALPDITADAALTSSQYYDPIKGFSAMSYTIDLSDVNFPNIPIRGALAHSATESEAYLRTDGSNYMKDYIEFIDAGEHGNVTEAEDNYGIKFIETIEFDEDASTPTGITEIDTISFDADNNSVAINDLRKLNFSTAGGTEINNIRALNFHTGNNQGIIKNLNTINFEIAASIGTIKNLKTLEFGSMGNITGVGTLSFDPYAGVSGSAVAKISGVEEINFATGTSKAQITGINEINFEGGTKINTMYVTGICKVKDSGKSLTIEGQSACFAVGQGRDASCTIAKKTYGYTTYWWARRENAQDECRYRCIVWNNNYNAQKRWCQS